MTAFARFQKCPEPITQYEQKRYAVKFARAAKRETAESELRWGPVFIIGGQHRGRIGYYDDDNHDGAIVYSGDFLLADEYWVIPYRFVQYATLDSLLRRREGLQTKLTWANLNSRSSKDEKYKFLVELFYIENAINDKMFFARYGEPTKDGRNLFMSHSSKDKWFVHKVADDLRNLGHDVWLDRRIIKVGQ